VAGLTRVRSVDSTPPIGVASGIRLISKKAANAHRIANELLPITPT